MKFLTLPSALVAWLILRLCWDDETRLSLKARVRLLWLFAVAEAVILADLAVTTAEMTLHPKAGTPPVSFLDLLQATGTLYLGVSLIAGILLARASLAGRA